MTTDVADGAEAVAVAPAADPGFLQRHGSTIEYILIPGAALVGALVVFGIFVALFGKNPLDLYFYMYQGAFGTWFSWQNTLTRAAPLILTALCTALPAQLGMVIIGGEGALLIGALASTSIALAMQWAPPLAVQLAMAAAGMIAGGLWIMLSGGLRQYRGIPWCPLRPLPGEAPASLDPWWQVWLLKESRTGCGNEDRAFPDRSFDTPLRSRY